MNENALPEPSSAPVLARVVRGDTVESMHRGHLVIMDADKHLLFTLGDPHLVTFTRSAAKAFQAIPFVASGAADRFGMGENAIALACASHSGEPEHAQLAEDMLAKVGFSEADLQCGTHLPFSEAASEKMLRSGSRPTALHNNCSGKHAAMLALAKHIGADPGRYLETEHPVQQQILHVVAEFAELSVGAIRIGIDGCGAPNFAMPLVAMARSFANLISSDGPVDPQFAAAARRIVAATIAFPNLIGGTGRLDTMLMQAARGRLISKVGADGVWLCGVLPSERSPNGCSIALKIEDGDDRRARPAVAVEILRQLGVLSRNDLADVSPLPLTNRRGDRVGSVTVAEFTIS